MPARQTHATTAPVRRALCATTHAHATTAPRTSRIVRDNTYRPVRPRRTLPPRHVRRALCATIHIAPCAQGARYHRVTYVAHPARQPTPPRAPKAHATSAPRTSRILRDNPHRARAQNAHATTAPRTSRIVRDHPHRAVRPRRTLRPHRVRRALCATIHIAPCAECARYDRAAYVAHLARQPTSHRAPKAHATAL